jgi:hypothetical protein
MEPIVPLPNTHRLDRNQIMSAVINHMREGETRAAAVLAGHPDFGGIRKSETIEVLCRPND